MIKLSQCLLGDTESILFLVSEKKDELPEPEPEENDGKEKQQNEFVESPESLDDEPPSKIAKASRQSTITEFASTSRNMNSETAPQPHSAARARKVKIYSEQEI